MRKSEILFLWDIDGALISVGGAGERAMKNAILEVFHVKEDLSIIDYAGRTDRRIAQMLHDYFEKPITDTSQQTFLDAYIHHLAIEMKVTQMHVLPGVKPILDSIDQNAHFHQGLLTGNLDKGAEIKLGHFDLWRYFPFGAFSNLSIDRNELSKFALLEATRCTHITFKPQNVFVIGDTPHDIECGNVIGANTVAVATGRYSSEELSKHAPTFVLDQLPESAAFFERLGLG